MNPPQLSLRELFLLVALAAMGCGWWVDHARLTRQMQWDGRVDALRRAIEDDGYSVVWSGDDWVYVGTPGGKVIGKRIQESP